MAAAYATNIEAANALGKSETAANLVELGKVFGYWTPKFKLPVVRHSINNK